MARWPTLLLTGALLIAGAVVLAGASADAQGRFGPLAAACAADLTVDPPSGPTAQTWSGAVGSDVRGGDVEVHVPGGRIDVATWGRWEWRVEVGGSAVAPARTQVHADTDDGRFDLEVEGVSETVGVDTASLDRPVVRVRLPALHFQRITVDVTTPADDRPADLAETVRPPGVRVATVRGGTLTVAGDVLRTALAGATLDRAKISAHTADVVVASSRIGELGIDLLTAETLCVADHAGTTVTVRAGTADLLLADLDIRDLQATIDDGSLVADGLAAANATASLATGDIDVEAAPPSNGTYLLNVAEEGSVALTVPEDARHGYLARLIAPDGTARHSLSHAVIVREDPHARTVRTTGFEERPVRTDVTLATERGDVTLEGEGSGTPPTAPGDPAPPTGQTAGLLAAAGIALYLIWSKAKLGAAALFSRIHGDEALEHDLRRRIHEVVHDEPGIHFRALKRELGVARGTLEHHLDKLVHTGHLCESSSSGYRCFFPAGAVDRRVMEAAQALRTETARRVFHAARRMPGGSLAELAAEAGLSDASTSYHLRRLADVGLLEKERDGRRLKVRLTTTGERAVHDLNLA